MAGFQPGATDQVVEGMYTNSGGTVTITWAGGTRETWRVTNPATDLARLDFASSTSGATVGWGFGSKAPHDAYVDMDEVPLHPYRGHYAGVNQNSQGAAGSTVMNVQNFARCHTNCLSWLSPPTATCSACPDGSPSSPIRYYLAGAGRRTFYEHWCRCLTGPQCYSLGSHRKPMLQVIGDNGAFHGWVGVEASNTTPNAGYFAVNYHVDV